MTSAKASPARVRKPHWYLVPVRVLLVTFLMTLLAFAVSMLLSIVGFSIYSWIRSVPPNFGFAYRHIAPPFAVGVGAIVLVLSLMMEIRHYRQAKALASIERAG
jgi:hypothetical protein